MSKEIIIEILRFSTIGLVIIGFILAAWAIWRIATEDKRRVAWAIKTDNKLNKLRFEIEEREREIAREIMGEDGRDDRGNK